MPAVVGTGHATKLIRTGQLVRVDGDRGVVSIVG
jgi:pyruvate, water dikinase